MTEFAQHPDELGERLVELGLSPNIYILDINGALTADEFGDEAPWNLPSRVMRFPIVYGAPSYDKDGKPVDRCLSLMHPDLSNHPFVKKVERLLSRSITFEDASKVKYQTKHAQWWHAVDLISSGHYNELIETRNFTTDEGLLAAASYALSYGPDKSGQGYITLQQARALCDLVAAQMANGADLDLSDFLDKAPPKEGEINIHRRFDKIEEIAILIAGIERGAFRYKGRFLRWTHCIESEQMLLL